MAGDDIQVESAAGELRSGIQKGSAVLMKAADIGPQMTVFQVMLHIASCQSAVSGPGHFRAIVAATYRVK